jgi:CBS domain-containing protein
MFSMKVREVMTHNPVCCTPTDTAKRVAQILCEQNVGSLPVVRDKQSLMLIGMITDRDLCCSIVAAGLDPKSTTIEKHLSINLVTCRDGENLDKCERAMQEHQIRRVPVVDGVGRCIGIVSQADLALKDKAENVSKTVAEISKPKSPAIAA